MSIFIIISITVLFLYNYNQISQFKERDIKIDSNKIQKEIKITQISDFHSNRLINIKKLALQIKSFNPDFIVITGDIVNRKEKDFKVSLELLRIISRLKKDIYYVRGNHEKFNHEYESLKDEMKKIGIVILENTSRTIIVKNEKLNIMGLDFNTKSENTKIINCYEDIINNINENYYNVLLRHSPSYIKDILKGDEDLVLSGHTHGGQVRLPFIGAIISPEKGLFPKCDKGKFYINNTVLYIDSGLGNSNAAIRLFNPVQFSNITIQPK